MTAPLGVPELGGPGGVPSLDPLGEQPAGPDMNQKMDEMLAMQQAILSLLEGGPPPGGPASGPVPPLGAGAPPIPF